MAKPWQHHNRPNTSKGEGDGAEVEGGEGAAEAGEEGREGNQGVEDKEPPVEGWNNRRSMRPERAERRRGRQRTRRGERRKGTGTERLNGGHW